MMDLERIESDEVMEEAQQWLARTLGIGNRAVENILSNQVATIFLLVFPILEQRAFKGFMRGADVYDSSIRYSRMYSGMNIDYITRHFYERYQEFRHYEGLNVDRHERERFESLLRRPYETLTDEEKFYLTMMTVYRYRNNIFHGNKEIASWPMFSKEIRYCIEFMMRFVDQFIYFSKEERIR